MSEGTKADTGKPDPLLLPKSVKQAINEVLQFGASKYKKNNWKGGFKYSRIFAALERHLEAYQEGQAIDPESGISHLAHAACNLVFLIYFDQNPEKYGHNYDLEEYK